MTVPMEDRRSTDRLDVSEACIGHRFGHFRHSAVRGVTFVSAMAVFFYAANVIDPGQSSAVDGLPLEQIDASNETSPIRSSGSLGALTSLDFTVQIHATTEGPRYTILDADGVLLGEMLEAEEVEMVAPGLELGGMLAEPMMLADPVDEIHR